MTPEELLTDDSFLAWYFETDPRKVKEWELKLEADASLRAVADDAVKVLEALASGEEEVSDRQLRRAKEQLIGRINSAEPGRKYAGQWNFTRYRWGAIAAAVSLVIASVYFWMPAETAAVTYRTGERESKRIELADGSVVNLNAQSVLRLSDFEKNDQPREVWLEGEAYFDVKKLPTQRAFIVHSGELDVEVLGTEFNVRKQKERTEVVLASGTVQLSSVAMETVVMKPGELVAFSNVSKTFSKRDVNPEVYTAWKEGKIVFENAMLPEIVEILTDRYGMEVEVEKDSELGQFNGVFPADRPDVLLKALEKTYESKIEVRNGKVFLRK